MTPPLRLIAALYPFVAGAAAVNLYFASLLASWVGTPPIDPWQAAFWGLPLGMPLAWAFARHIARLMAEADGK